MGSVKNGFTLLEGLIGLSVVVMASGILAHSLSAVQLKSRLQNEKQKFSELQQMILTHLDNPKAWVLTEADPINALACVGQGNCQAGAKALLLYDAGGGLVSHAEGYFDSQLNPCDPSREKCSTKVNLTWEPICDGVGTCDVSMVRVRGQFSLAQGEGRSRTEGLSFEKLKYLSRAPAAVDPPPALGNPSPQEGVEWSQSLALGAGSLFVATRVLVYTPPVTGGSNAALNGVSGTTVDQYFRIDRIDPATGQSGFFARYPQSSPCHPGPYPWSGMDCGLFLRVRIAVHQDAVYIFDPDVYTLVKFSVLDGSLVFEKFRVVPWGLNEYELIVNDDGIFIVGAAATWTTQFSVFYRFDHNGVLLETAPNSNYALPYAVYNLWRAAFMGSELFSLAWPGFAIGSNGNTFLQKRNPLNFSVLDSRQMSSGFPIRVAANSQKVFALVFNANVPSYNEVWLHGYDAGLNPIWGAPLRAGGCDGMFPGLFTLWWDIAADDTGLYLTCPNTKGWYAEKLDAQTGATIWKIER